MKVYTEIAQMVTSGNIRIRTQTQNPDGSWNDAVDVHFDPSVLRGVLEGGRRLETTSEVNGDGTASLSTLEPEEIEPEASTGGLTFKWPSEFALGLGFDPSETTD